jgi:hypothetical protein
MAKDEVHIIGDEYAGRWVSMVIAMKDGEIKEAYAYIDDEDGAFKHQIDLCDAYDIPYPEGYEIDENSEDDDHDDYDDC